MQQRISEVASVLVEFYESGDHSRKPLLNEQLGDMRSRAGAWRDALWWIANTPDMGATCGRPASRACACVFTVDCFTS